MFEGCVVELCAWGGVWFLCCGGSIVTVWKMG